MGSSLRATENAVQAGSPLRSQSRFTVDSLIDLVVDCHTGGRAIRDPSPSILTSDGHGRPVIPDADFEYRSDIHVPHLALHQLWSLMDGSSSHSRLAAGAAYLERRNWSTNLEEAHRQHRRQRTERCFHENRDFKVVQAGGLVWHCRRSALRDAHFQILCDPDRFLAPGPKQLKDGITTTVSITPGDAILKRFNPKKLRSLLKHHFSPSRARRAFQGAYHLELLGIATPRPIAFAERRRCGLLLRSYLLMEYLPDAMAIDEFTRQWSVDSTPMRKVAVENVGRIVGQLHEAGFANRDLKTRNLLVSEAGDVWIIDLDGVHYRDRVNDETRLKNLLRMVRDLRLHGRLSTRDRMRFLRSYTVAAGSGEPRILFDRLAAESIADKR